MLYLSYEGYRKSIMLKAKTLYMCFVDLEKDLDTVSQKVLE